MTGTVDFVRRLSGSRSSESAFGIIVADGKRFFAPSAECPRDLGRADRVAFDPDVHADPRGPIACRVRVLARAAATPPETLLPDAVITCLDCGVPFTWSSAEQAFYRGRNFDPPKRCKPCRRTRTAAGASLAPRRERP